MNEIREVFESVAERIRSPFFGYFFVSWAIVNWKPLFFLLVSNETVIERFAFFDNNTSIGSMLLIPVLVGFSLALASPWVRWFFVWAAEFPTTRISLVQAKSESSILQRKAELAAARESLKAVQEESLIAAAERDQKILSIDDRQVREKLQAQIDELREKMNEPATWDSLGGAGGRDERTNLRLDLVKEGSGYKFKLVNIGQAEAKNIEFELIDIDEKRDPIPQSEYDKFPVPMLSPGGAVSLIAAIAMGSPTSYTAKVSWESPGGVVTKKTLFASL